MNRRNNFLRFLEFLNIVNVRRKVSVPVPIREKIVSIVEDSLIYYPLFGWTNVLENPWASLTWRTPA